MVGGKVRRARLRLLRVAGTPGGAWDPPQLSLSPRQLRGEGVRFRATIDDTDKLTLRVEREGAEPHVLDRLVRIPGGRVPSDGAGRYFGRWEYARNRVVISASGAGLIERPDTTTLEPSCSPLSGDSATSQELSSVNRLDGAVDAEAVHGSYPRSHVRAARWDAHRAVLTEVPGGAARGCREAARVTAPRGGLTETR